MDEMTLLREFRSDAPDTAPPPAVRQRLLTETLPRSPRRPWHLAAGAAVAAAAVTVALVVTAVGPGASPSAAEVLGLAARTVAATPVERPADDQWVYQSYQFAGPQGEAPSVLGEAWTRFDGTEFADHASDSTRVDVQPLVDDETPTPAEWWDFLTTLPADPEALLARLRTDGPVDGEGATQAARDFDAVTASLTNAPVLPPQAHARLFRALATIPGVEIDEDAAPDLAGRDVLAVVFTGETQDGSAVRNRHELLLDPSTYAYRGDRVTALEDGTLAGGSPVSEGERWYDGVLVDTAVVDRPGLTH
ncbi:MULTISPECIES: CU044_5270 family protein [unclassified Nocardioides]|uniref:CU044_5270 family protein n=1 Tax=unclassified Nocardioides TaxID=2615069 RepID=UPI0009F0F644|nr:MULTISPECIES: CU044_5270 family protein [unclassified Nocardioides]GAW50844.1 uncharacterized protein PD653B2_3180 [Nocardioides sp. PD653-B2]GAW52783.1 uncharacterized protein PD653_0176 [Nocardioides sp. PD653]